jgi:signal transduction histidine kinase
MKTSGHKINATATTDNLAENKSLQWKCRTFSQTLLFGLIHSTILPLSCFIWFRQWTFAAVLLTLELLFYIAGMFSKRLHLNLAVNITFTGATLVTFSYLIPTASSDPLYFIVFLIIITGIFVGPSAAFAWSAIYSVLLILLAGFSDSFNVFPEMKYFFSGGLTGIVSTDYFSTFILLFFAGAFLSVLFQNYFAALLKNVQTADNEKALLESELFQAQKLESIALLAGGIAHDFNHGLTSIKSCANLILKKTDENNSEIRKYARSIYDTCGVINSSTARLLTFTRKSRGDYAAVDLHDVVDSMVTLLKYQLAKNITMTTSLDARNSFITGDFSQLQSVLMNLALNAGDAMPNGGTITFSTATVSDSDVKSINGATAAHGSYIRLSIKDTGFGMERQTIEKIFVPFFTTKAKGTGLGLAVVSRIVKNHHGFIDVISEPGKGSTFIMFFPEAQKPAILVTTMAGKQADAEKHLSPA